jgi:uncharacterized membrane protein YeiH
MRDTFFVQQGSPAFMQDARYIWAVLAATVFAAMTYAIARRVERAVAAVDALGLGTYAVVGVQKALAAGLSPLAAILVGVVNAVGGGLIRDVLVRDEPLLLKPGQYYTLAALLGCVLFVALQFYELEVVHAAWITIAAVFAMRMLAIRYNWQTGPMGFWQWRRRPRDGDRT